MRALILVSFVLSIFSPLLASAQTTKSHGIAIHGQPSYPADFTHFKYVNPDAPKGGTLRIAREGTFDSFNPYIIKGVPGPGFSAETLLTSSADEASSEYGLIAESLEWPEDRSWVIFTLRPEAKWHDGKPITVDDVIYSLNIIKTQAIPYYRNYFGVIDRAESLGDRRVKFYSSEAQNREFPIIAGGLPILAKHYWDGRDFSKSTLEPPLSSGPYRVKEFEAGRYVVEERVKKYWGINLPVNKGQDNFDIKRTTFYYDDDISKLAIKSGKIDYRSERSSSAWAQDYDVPAIVKGWLKKEAVPHKRPQGIQGYFFNTRREIFKDIRVREALSYAFDFEWTNENLSHGLLTRSTNYFGNSELSSKNLPGGRELAILESYRNRLPIRLFSEPFSVPTTDGSGWPRGNYRKAFAILEEAGWIVKDLKLVNKETGKQMTFEILLASKGMERTVLPFVNNLRQLGIVARTRLVDNSQYNNRTNDFDYDMVIVKYPTSISPGAEQRGYWTSKIVSRKGGYNFAGINDPIVDELVEGIVNAKDRVELVASVRALDRVLLWGFYVIPQFHVEEDRLLFWDKFSRPDITPWRGTSTSYWWLDRKKEAALNEAMASALTIEGNVNGSDKNAITSMENEETPFIHPLIVETFSEFSEKIGLDPKTVKEFFTFQIFTNPNAFFQKDNWRPYALGSSLILLLLLKIRRRRRKGEQI